MNFKLFFSFKQGDKCKADNFRVGHNKMFVFSKFILNVIVYLTLIETIFLARYMII